MASLRQIAKYCEYNDTLNMMLRNQLVCGVNHQTIQKQLLGEKELTYERRALEIALSIETAEKDVKNFQKASSTITVCTRKNLVTAFQQGMSKLVQTEQQYLIPHAIDA